MTRIVRSFLSTEAVVFAAAALLHTGTVLRGHEHAAARNAESIIALVLLAGVAATVVAPAFSRTVGLTAQGFALLGTLIGVFVIAIGIGPRTPLDFVLHAIMLALLVTGCLVVARRRVDAVA